MTFVYLFLLLISLVGLLISMIEPPLIKSEHLSKEDTKKVFVITSFVFGLLFVMSGIFSLSTSPSANQETVNVQPVAVTPTNVMVGTVGEEALIRFHDNRNDSSQVICLAPNKEVYGELSKTLRAKDVMGILELTDKGVFCVSNGSKVLVLETSSALTKVRILSGVNAEDADKIGRSGWTAMEWIGR